MGIKNKEIDQWNQIKDPNINTHTPINTWFLTKMLKIYNGQKKASSTNGAGINECQHVENEKRSISIPMHKTQIQMNQRPQQKTTYTEPHRRESGK